jgi:hypothetical protein
MLLAAVPNLLQCHQLLRCWRWLHGVFGCGLPCCDGVFVCGLCAQPQHGEPMGCGFQNHVLVQLPESLPAY